MNKQMVTQTRTLLEQSKSQLKVALPKHLDADYIIRVTMTEIQARSELQKCDPMSVVGSVIKAAELGLEVGSAKGHAYLVPYGNKAQLILGYRGMIDLARRSGQVSHISARVVQQSDELSVSYGLQETIEHKPSFDESPITHVYAVAHFKNGEKLFDVMSKKEVDDVKSRSKASRSGPWVTDESEMMRKTVVRRLCKYIPMSSELSEALALDERADRGEQANAALVEGEGGGFVAESSADRLKKKLQKTEEKEVKVEVEDNLDWEPPKEQQNLGGTS